MKLYPAWAWLWLFPGFISTSAYANRADSAWQFTHNKSPLESSFSIPDSIIRGSLENPFDFGVASSDWCYVLVKLVSDALASDEEQLVVDNTSLDSILIFRLWSNGLREMKYIGGCAVPYDSSRATVWHAIEIDRGEEGLNYLIAMRASGQNVNVRIDMRSRKELNEIHHSYERLIFFYLGCIGVIFVSALVGSILLRRKALVFYAGYIACAAGWVVAHYGYAFAFLYPQFPDLNYAIKPITSLLALWFFFNLVFGLVPQILQHPGYRTILKSLQAAVLIVAVVEWFRVVLTYSDGFMLTINVIWNVLLLTSIVILMILLIRLAFNSLIARLLIVAAGAPLLMTLFQIFSNAGYINSRALNEHGLLAAQLFEVILLAFVIIYTIFRERIEREAALQLLQDQQKQTLQSLIHLQDNERKRISQDLHDSIGPLLAAIKINVRRLGDQARSKEDMDLIFSQTDSILEDSILEIRNISHKLMPKELSSKGLIFILSDYFEDLEPLYKLSIHFRHDIAVSLPEEIQSNVYHIICELVNNAAKHSEAKTIGVTIETKSDLCTLVIKDDGKGFDVNQRMEGMFGLAGMQRRVLYLKGSFDIDSHPGGGTSITIAIPLFIPD